MRTEEDIIRVRVGLSGILELDLERIELDPNWRQIAMTYDLNDSQERAKALMAYVSHYVVRERFLREMPSTNGPGELNLLQMEVVYGQPDGIGADRNSEQRCAEARVPGTNE
jgi:hypothetical protein